MSENPLGEYHCHRITSITYRPYRPNIFKEKDLKIK